jgi:hypothetical protein
MAAYKRLPSLVLSSLEEGDHHDDDDHLHDLQNPFDSQVNRTDHSTEGEIELVGLARDSKQSQRSTNPALAETVLSMDTRHYSHQSLDPSQTSDFHHNTGSWMLADEPITTLTPFDVDCMLAFFALH